MRAAKEIGTHERELFIKTLLLSLIWLNLSTGTGS